MLKLTEHSILGMYTVEFDKFADNRGSFMEIFRNSGNPLNDKHFFNPGQINLSTSQKGVIRGLHFSLAPEQQDKLVIVSNGSILDTILDVRIDSPTFGEHIQVELSSESNQGILIRSGLAHGFSVLSDSASVVYLMSSHYQPEMEHDIHPLDPELKIEWKVSKPILSKKDSIANSLKQAQGLGILPRCGLNK
jgi:dTDP-4-dehydrorhamnose 3,5-epimerase